MGYNWEKRWNILGYNGYNWIIGIQMDIFNWIPCAQMMFKLKPFQGDFQVPGLISFEGKRFVIYKIFLSKFWTWKDRNWQWHLTYQIYQQSDLWRDYMRMGKDTAATLRWVLPQPSGCHRGQTSTAWVVKQWGNKCITMYNPTCLKRKTCK